MIAVVATSAATVHVPKSGSFLLVSTLRIPIGVRGNAMESIVNASSGFFDGAVHLANTRRQDCKILSLAQKGAAVRRADR